MIVLEHTLVILLLLVGLLNARPNLPRFARWAITIALALVLVVPAAPLALPWEWLSALIIPLLLWQISRRLTEARPAVPLKDLLIWLGVTLGIGGILFLTSELTLAGSMMFGVLAAGMIWRGVEDDRRPTVLSQVGPLALAFLLAEIAPAVEAPGRYASALLIGAGVGAALGYLGVQAAQRLKSAGWVAIVSLGQVYLAYWTALAFGVSGVAAALMSVGVYVAYGTKRGLWPGGEIRPKPLDSPPVFILAVLALAFFAWQTHVPITSLLILEIVLVLAFTVLVIRIGRSLKVEPFQAQGSYSRLILPVGFLLAPALLLWPRAALLDPLPLMIALATAALATIGAQYALTPLLNVSAWLDEAGSDVENPDRLIHTLLVRDLMDRDRATIAPTTPVPEIARLLTECRVECLPVVDAELRLLGIVTEHDLFLKEERLPRAAGTYQAVFKEPVTPEQLPEVYAQRGAVYTAADVMTSKVAWVRETSPVSQAVRLMVAHGFKCLPVLDAAPEAGGKLAGVITRSGIVRLLAQEKPPAGRAPAEPDG